MPIITPAYPQQNSTFNVSVSTRAIMMEEFKNGLKLTDEIMLGKQPWEKLFEAPLFFQKYRHFIVLLVSATTAEDHLEWSGLVESKVRLLIGTLERNQHITLAHINPECYSHINAVPNTACSMWFIGLEFAKTENLNVNLTCDIQTFTENVNRHALSIKMFKEGMKLEAKHVKRKHLNQYLPPMLLKRERKISTTVSKITPENRKRHSVDESVSACKKSRPSDESSVTSSNKNVGTVGGKECAEESGEGAKRDSGLFSDAGSSKTLRGTDECNVTSSSGVRRILLLHLHYTCSNLRSDLYLYQSAISICI